MTAPYRFEALAGIRHFVAEQAPERVNELLLAHIELLLAHIAENRD